MTVAQEMVMDAAKDITAKIEELESSIDILDAEIREMEASIKEKRKLRNEHSAKCLGMLKQILEVGS